MKRITSIVLLLLVSYVVKAQDATTQSSIHWSLCEFFSELDAINDPEAVKSDVKDIVHSYLNGTYFKFNDVDVNNRARFIKQTYCTEYLESRIITHSLGDVGDWKFVDQGDCWKVSGKLKAFSGTGEDYIIKDADAEFLIRYNGPDKNITILEIKTSPQLYVLYPQWYIQYDLKVNKDIDNLLYNQGGGEFDIDIISRARQVKKYGNEVAEKNEWYFVEYTILNTDGLEVVSRNEDKVTIRVSPNYSNATKYYDLTFCQTMLSGELYTKEVKVSQRGVPIPPNPLLNEDQRLELGCLYGFDNDIGIKWMLGAEDRRLWIGVEGGFDMDYVGVGFATPTSKDNNYPSISISNGYKITEQKVLGKNATTLVDPYNEAKPFYNKAFLLPHVGVNLHKYLRFDLGLGVMWIQRAYFMKNTYDYIKYSYESLSEDLPPIDDVYRYIRTNESYYYKEKTQWNFAIHPSVNVLVPLGEYSDLTLGVGYLYVPYNNEHSETSIGLGLTFNI